MATSAPVDEMIDEMFAGELDFDAVRRRAEPRRRTTTTRSSAPVGAAAGRPLILGDSRAALL